MPSIACEIITIASGTTYSNRLQKYTKGLTLSTSTSAKIRFFYDMTKFILFSQRNNIKYPFLCHVPKASFTV